MSRRSETVGSYLTVEETAEHLRVSVPTLNRWRCAGEGPRFLRLGVGRNGRTVYSLADVDEWAASRAFQSTTEADVADRTLRYRGVAR